MPEFAEVAFKMFPGQLSNPIKTQFGWHIIKAEDKRAKPVPEFEKVKDQIEGFLMRKAQTEFVVQAAPERQDRASRQVRREEAIALLRRFGLAQQQQYSLRALVSTCLCARATRMT